MDARVGNNAKAALSVFKTLKNHNVLPTSKIGREVIDVCRREESLLPLVLDELEEANVMPDAHSCVWLVKSCKDAAFAIRILPYLPRQDSLLNLAHCSAFINVLASSNSWGEILNVLN